MIATRKLRLAILFLVLVCSIVFDKKSKQIARSELGRHGPVMLPCGFGELGLAENPGSFLSLGVSFPQSLRLAVFIAGVGAGLLALFAYLAGRSTLNWLSFIGLALAMAGGMSNLIDRITRQGLVTDFIFLRVGPLHTGIFNLADFMIVMGVAVVVCPLWKRPHSPLSQGSTKQDHVA